MTTKRTSKQPKLTYVPYDPPIPPPISHDRTGLANKHSLGCYKVEFDDGITINMPHHGVPGTLGAEPLDLNDPEQRSWLVEEAMVSAEQVRQQLNA